MIALKKGDSYGCFTIIDEDRLCFQVMWNGVGKCGVRTISKALLEEFIQYYNSHPGAKSLDARNDLKGKSRIDTYEYGYNATLWAMAGYNKIISGK